MRSAYFSVDAWYALRIVFPAMETDAMPTKPAPRDPLIDAVAGIASDIAMMIVGIGVIGLWAVTLMGGAEAMRGWF